MIALRRILVPTNLGEPSKTAVTYGVAFARRFGAQLAILRVVPASDLDAAVEAERVVEILEPEGQDAPGPTAEQVLQTLARAELGRLLDPQEARDAVAEYLLRPAGPGGVPHEIAACARDLGVDLIIMGRHRQGRVDQMLAGSVTEKVVRQAPCPVLVVHHPEHEFVLPDDAQTGATRA